MALKLVKKDRVRIPVECEVPRDKGAGYEKQTILATVKKLYGAEAEDFNERRESMTVADQIRELLIDLEQVKDENGNELPFSDDLLDQIFEIDYIYIPLWQACVSAQNELVRRQLAAKN